MDELTRSDGSGAKESSADDATHHGIDRLKSGSLRNRERAPLQKAKREKRNESPGTKRV